MSQALNVIDPIRLFISYAWETDEFRNEVWSLAGYIHNNSLRPVKVISDHLYSKRPPPVIWATWMQQEIESADLVLVICSPKYFSCFEGLEDLTSKGGYGVTHEANIIRQLMLGQKGHNTKFYPVTPDSNDHSCIPLTLKGYNNGLSFPSKNKGILELIYGDNPVHGPLAVSDSVIDLNTIDGLVPVENVEIQLVEELNGTIEELDRTSNESQMNMNFDKQVLIRSYLLLTDLQRIGVIKKFGFDLKDFDSLSPFEKDRIFIKEINDRNLLNELWDEINNIQPFYN